MKRFQIVFGLAAVLVAVGLYAQNSPEPNAVQVQQTQAKYFMTPISNTAAINTQLTLTIPAPSAGLYNYICSLHYSVLQDGTATAVNQAVTTSTNFNSFAITASAEDVAQKVFLKDFYWGTPSTGCVKSTTPATATTFVSPAAVTNASFWFAATYYQAP